MSDLAILSPADSQSEGARSFAILSTSPQRATAADANFMALLNSMPDTVSVITGAERDAAAGSEQSRVGTKVSDAHAVVVVSPRLDSLRESAYLARLALRSRIAGRVFVMVAVAAKPSGGRLGRILKRVAVKNADLTIVRDEASADVLLEAGVEGPLRIGADPAWTELGELFAARPREDRLVVAVDESMDIARVSALADVLKSVADSGMIVELQSWTTSPSDDQSVTEGLVSILGDSVKVLPSPASLREAREIYASSRAVIATRFNAVMAAAASGTPTLAMGEGSTSSLASKLGLDVVAGSASVGDLNAAVEKLLSNGTVANAAVPSLIDRARASLDLVRFTLSEGVDTPSTANEPLPLYPSPWRQ